MEFDLKIKDNILYENECINTYFSISKVNSQINDSKNNINSNLETTENINSVDLKSKIDKIINKNPISIPTYEELFME